MSIQLTSRLRFVPLNDEAGDFGLLIVHDGPRVNYTITVNDRTELKAAIESFQEKPVGLELV